jgi:hypothetical protein
MAAWKVKAMAIQLSPIRNWPNPKPQPISSDCLSDPARETISHSEAMAKIISGHQPTGWNANAERAPITSAIRNCMKRR